MIMAKDSYGNYVEVEDIKQQNSFNGISPIEFQSSGDNLENYRIYGNTVNGESVGDKTNNLFDGEWTQGSIDNAGNIWGGNQNRIKTIVSVIPSQTYTIRTNLLIRMIFAYNDTTEASGKVSSLLDAAKGVEFATITIPNNANLIAVSLMSSDNSNITPSDVEWTMLNVGSEALPYEPYGYKVPVKIRGINLFDESVVVDKEANTAYSNYQIYHQGGILYINGTTTSTQADIEIANISDINSEMLEYINQNYGKYVFTSISPGTIQIRFSNSNSEGYIYTNNSYTSTSSKSANRLIFRMQKDYQYDHEPIGILIKKEEQIQSAYEPYHTPITTNLYLPEQIKKVGDEAEYIDFMEQKQHFADGTSADVTLPAMSTFSGTNILSVNTNIKPSKVWGGLSDLKDILYVKDKLGNILFSKYYEVNGISPLSFKSKTNNNSILKNYRIYGNTVSDESVGDKTNNLFDGNFLQGYWAYADGSFVNTNTWICTNKIPCTEGQVYTYSFAKTSRQTGFVWYDANGDYISSSNAQDYSSTSYRLYSATAPIDAAFMIVNIAGYPESPNAIAPSDITDFMLVKGQYTSNTMPSYEPYGYRIPVTVTNGTDTETTNLYLPEQIKMVGDEAEYIDFKEQKQHRVRKNLLQNTGTSRTINGVTFTVNSDGSVTCNTDENGATATAIFNVYAQNFTLASDNYILSGCPIGGDISTKYKLDAQVFTDGFESWISDIGDGANIYSDKIITILLMRIVIYKNQVCDNLTFYPMIRKADISDDTYEPYITNTELNVTLPSISVPSGINILSVETGVQPSDIYLKGKIEKKPKIYYYSDDRQTLLYTESVLKGENGTYSSPPEKTNYTFLGWQPRAININKNENCYAVFVEQNENEAILIMCATNTIYNNKNAIGFLFKHSVPADKYDIVKIGIHYGTNKLAGANTTISGYATADLTVDGATYGVNDVETVLQTGANSIKNYVAKYTSHSGKISISYAIGNNVDAYALAIGYIQAVEKETGNNVTFYSNLISTTYNKCSQLYTVTFYNDATLLKTGKTAYGDSIIYSGATPTRASTQQYEYTFLGWNTNPLATTVDINALSNVTSDRTVYAIFTAVSKGYTVYFYNGETLLETVTGVPSGGTATYTGATPTKQGYSFTGWSPLPTNITADTSCYAQFEEDEMYESITDTWDEIIANVSNGTYSTKYQIGDTKKIDLGTEGEVIMTIVGIDTDDLADNSGKAPITWISKQMLKTSKTMNDTFTNYLSDWTNCDMRTYLKNTVLPMLPSVVQNNIKEVTKYTNQRTGSKTFTTISSTEDIWLPSYREVSNDTSHCETSGVQYNSIFTDNASRVKSKVGNSADFWWTRSASGSSSGYCSYYFARVNSDGTASYYGDYCTSSRGVAIGFCT